MHGAPGEDAPANHSDTLDASLSPESASGAQQETMGPTGRAALNRAPCMAALMFAWPTAIAEPLADPISAPDPEFLEFLGETSGMDPELVAFMQSSEAKRAVKDAARKAAAEAEPAESPDALPTESERIMAEGVARWQSMSDTDRAAARARFNTWRELPPAQRAEARERWKRFRALTPAQQEAAREAYREFLELSPERRETLTNRWQQMSPEERRRAIQRRQGSKPDTVDRRPCPPC